MRLIYHHAVDLAFVPGPVELRSTPGSELCPGWHETAGEGEYPPDALWFEPAYAWLAERAGFWPLFLAVGESDDDLRLTGYQDQWRRALAPSPERVLFSYADLPDPLVFSDHSLWHIVLSWAMNAGHPDPRMSRPVSRGEERQILRRSWPRARWLRYTKRYAVQACVPALDLAAADRVWCRNQATRRELVRRGFAAERVEVGRLRVSWLG
jgi:hypothetical protein